VQVTAPFGQFVFERSLKDLNDTTAKQLTTRGRTMYSHRCTGRARPGGSQLGRIYHGSRVRGGHSIDSLIILIDTVSASQKLRIAPVILEAAAEHQMIPYYRIAGQIRFDPIDLDRWVRQHRIDEFTPSTREVE
jgi:hypothetical protein